MNSDQHFPAMGNSIWNERMHLQLLEKACNTFVGLLHFSSFVSTSFAKQPQGGFGGRGIRKTNKDQKKTNRDKKKQNPENMRKLREMMRKYKNNGGIKKKTKSQKGEKGEKGEQKERKKERTKERQQESKKEGRKKERKKERKNEIK